MKREKFSTVLINPRYQISHQPPLGLAYIASYLKAGKDNKIHIIDTTFEKLETKLNSVEKPDIFGIYIMTPYYERSVKTIKILRKKFPSVPIIAGGPHPSVDPEGTLEKLKINACVRGEGERTFSEIINSIKESKNMSDIHGVSFKETPSGKIRHNPNCDPIPDLDNLPFPARNLLPMEDYLRGGTQKVFSYSKIRTTTMITSRGCFFNCAYCQPTLDSIFSKKVRFRSVGNVIEEIKQLITDYSVEGILFADDTFTCNKKFVIQLCEEILHRKIKIKFAINSRVDTVDKEMLIMLKRAGVVTIMYGVESGSQKVLDNIKKRTKVEDIKRAVRITKEQNINVYGYFIIGTPEESVSSLKDTFSLLLRLPFDEVQFSIAAPYFGTYLYESAVSSGLIEDISAMEKDGYFSSVVMRSKYLSSRSIKRFYKYFDILSKYKSIKNIVLKYPTAISSILLNKIFPVWLGKRREIR